MICLFFELISLVKRNWTKKLSSSKFCNTWYFYVIHEYAINYKSLKEKKSNTDVATMYKRISFFGSNMILLCKTIIGCITLLHSSSASHAFLHSFLLTLVVCCILCIFVTLSSPEVHLDIAFFH